VVAARYERGSSRRTANPGFGEWGAVLGDAVRATAIRDRLLHHRHVLNLRGESDRLRETNRAGLLGVATVRPLPDGVAPATTLGTQELGQSQSGAGGSLLHRR
jgi:hypothetical protein